MTGRGRPRNEHIRDQLLAAVRIDPHQSTSDLASLIPSEHRRPDGTPWPLLNNQVYPHLRILEDRGLIRRVYVDGQKDVRWEPLPDADVVDVEQLEQMWRVTQ